MPSRMLEEAILNSLFCAVTTIGRDDYVALPADEMSELIQA